ncbi:MAG: prepilin-type N-terminal cleavage/methylation domain-containing protein [Candidatus Wallbacteria bacterium]|nr:prepilin-type N-terminal cleavage/methylation domain-containing protein [Candidatus Wallbacteria bacterium]
MGRTTHKGSGARPGRAVGREPAYRCGFTLVELLVTVALLLALTLMASGVYISYVKTGEESMVRNNLTQMRSALQQFYSDNGSYPFQTTDIYGNRCGFLDDSSSELTQGPRRGPGAYPANKMRYLAEIPIDPSLNSKGWSVLTEPFQLTASAARLAVVTDVHSGNPLFKDL